jgi:hypothetical protein
MKELQKQPMRRSVAPILVVLVLALAAGRAAAFETLEFTGVRVTDATGSQITEATQGQQVSFAADFTLERAGIALLHGTVSGANWSQTLNYRVKAGAKGKYTVTWTAFIPFNAVGQARADIIEYVPVFRERLVRSAYFTVIAASGQYVGPETCMTCHGSLYASWTQTQHYPNISCESCHGPGGAHASSPSTSNIVKSTSASVCKPCHARNDGSVIETENGFIKSQQQYNEWYATKHGRFLQCANCHNVHYSLETNAPNAMKLLCIDCHLLKTSIGLGMAGRVACVDCHMPPAVKSQESTGTGWYRKGDQPSHIWRINSAAEPGKMMPGNAVTKDADGPYLSVDFACLSCHDGFSARLYDYASVQQTAPIVH